MRKIKKVVVIGLGYVGLPTLVAIYKSGLYQVIGFDIDAKKVSQIKNKVNKIEKKLNKQLRLQSLLFIP